MFGYMHAAINDLSVEEKQRYNAVYCGLCRTLGQRYGITTKFSLTFEMTYLILFLSSLYEPAETTGTFRCGIHPWKKSGYILNETTDYAADLTVALAYHKCLDDWKDDHRRLALAYSRKLEPSYQIVKQIWPEQVGAIEQGIQQLSEIETASEAAPDAAANCFGTLLSQLFLYKRDHWMETLTEFGFGLGRFIYIMDAVMDCKEDQKSGNYNPVLTLNKTPAEMKEPLMLLIGSASQAFERLPLVQDVHLLRNILYSGVWQAYNRMLHKDKEVNEHG